MGAASLRLSDAGEYEVKLRKDRVIADFATRKSEIDKQLQVEAKRQNARLGEYQDSWKKSPHLSSSRRLRW